jgi:hypothetical protein
MTNNQTLFLDLVYGKWNEYTCPAVDVWAQPCAFGISNPRRNPKCETPNMESRRWPPERCAMINNELNNH